MWHMTSAELEDTREGQDAILRAEREQLTTDLRNGLAPLVCLSAPQERRRLVRITSLRDLDARGSPWRGL
jgi:hypothetical protein